MNPLEYQATECEAWPRAEALAEFLDPKRIKTEQEHAAIREIEKLKELLWDALYGPSSNQEWVGLTDKERAQLYSDRTSFDGFARAIEAKLKEKNKC